MSTPDDRLTDDVSHALQTRMPVDLSPGQAGKEAVNLLSLIAGNNVAGKDDWPAALELVGFGVLLAQAYPLPTDDQLPVPVPPASPSAPLWDYLAELFKQAETDLPMPPNSFQVGLHGSDVWVPVPYHPRMSKGVAINLAVWLLAVADPKLEAFGPMFAKVGGF